MRHLLLKACVCSECRSQSESETPNSCRARQVFAVLARLCGGPVLRPHLSEFTACVARNTVPAAPNRSERHAQDKGDTSSRRWRVCSHHIPGVSAHPTTLASMPLAFIVEPCLQVESPSHGAASSAASRHPKRARPPPTTSINTSAAEGLAVGSPAGPVSTDATPVARPRKKARLRSVVGTPGRNTEYKTRAGAEWTPKEVPRVQDRNTWYCLTRYDV